MSENIDFSPEKSLVSLQKPQDHVTVFSGERSTRDAEKYVFFNPDLTRNPNLLLETVLAKDFYKDKNQPEGEHKLRRMAYEDLTRMEAYLRGQMEEGNESLENKLMLQWISAQKARLAFMQAAEARIASKHHGDFLDDEEHARFMRDWAREFWGEPDPKLAKELAATVFTEEPARLPVSFANNAVDYYLETVANAGIKEKTEDIRPTREALTYYHKLLREVLQPTIDHVFEGAEAEEFSEEEAAPLFQKALDHLGLSDKGWRVELDLNKNNMSTDNFHKIVYIGKRKKPYTRQDIERLTLHEIFIHVQRSANGEDRDSFLLQYGMPGYLDFEEGLTTYSEFAWTGKVNNATHRRRFMVAAYAQGVFDGKFHDFYETFAFTFGFALLLAQSDKSEGQLNIDDIRDTAYKTYDETVRAFRGMDPKFKGVNDLALGSYYPGFVKVVEHLDPGGQGNYLSEDQFRQLLLGKFDPTVADQAAYTKEREGAAQ